MLLRVGQREKINSAEDVLLRRIIPTMCHMCVNMINVVVEAPFGISLNTGYGTSKIIVIKIIIK